MSLESKFLLIILAILANDMMDGMDFLRPRNSGWWSINSDLKYNVKFLGWSWDFDAWHVFKKLMWTFVGLAVFGFTWHFLLFAGINFIQHNGFYHLVLKKVLGKKE